MRATNIQWEPAKKGGFVTAMVNDLEYQEWFESEPTKLKRDEAVESFEVNYSGLNESNNKPVKVKPHHSEC